MPFFSKNGISFYQKTSNTKTQTMPEISELVKLLALERLEHNLFRGESKDVGSPNVFGGQVLAQALSAATQTVPSDRYVHSLHAYFILPGDKTQPIIFEVDRIRNGSSFTTRRVVAIQHGKAIFNMSASFQVAQKGYEHQMDMKAVPMPEELKTLKEITKQFEAFIPAKFKRYLSIDRPVEFKPVELINPLNPTKQPPFKRLWFRAKGLLPDDSATHANVLAYASDFNLLSTAFLPHAISYAAPNLQAASLDHSVWFHHTFRADDWLLYSTDSPSTSGGRGFCRGSIYSKEGKLVASVAQEGLMRVRE